jgi:long-chain acyl-CoA synthetase
VTPGYWKKPQDTEASFVGQFFRTGDVGYMDEDGFVFIVDRIKDMINASGFKVYPRRIEDALYEHSAVDEVTVVGIPDEYRGEAPKAFVKLKEGKQATAQELLQFLRGKAFEDRAAGRDRVPRSAAEDDGRQALKERAARRSMRRQH